METITYSPNDVYYTDNMTTTELYQNEHDTFNNASSVNMEHAIQLFFGLYCTMAVIGIIGNILVEIVIIKNHDMRNSVNLLIFNLSVADLLFLVEAFPAYLRLTFPTFNSVFALQLYRCRIGDFVYYLLLHCSALTLVAIALERYFVVCHPLRAKFVCTKKRTKIIILLIWIISALSAGPLVMMNTYTVKNEVLKCDTTGKINFIAYVNVVYTLFCGIPLAILVAVYSIIAYKLFKYQGNLHMHGNDHQMKERRQILKMLIVIVIIFVLCLLPERIRYAVTPNDWGYELRLEQLITGSFFYLNASINPIVYAFFSTRYRSEFMKIIKCHSQQSLDSSETIVTGST